MLREANWTGLCEEEGSSICRPLLLLPPPQSVIPNIYSLCHFPGPLNIQFSHLLLKAIDTIAEKLGKQDLRDRLGYWPKAILLISGGAGSEARAHAYNYYAKTVPLQRIRGHTEGSSIIEGVDGGSDLGVDEEVQGTVATATVRAWSRNDWHSPLSTLWSIKRVMYLSRTDYFNTIHTVSE